MKIEITDDDALPITIVADEHFSHSLKPLLTKLEMWLNFQALKANWYGDEDFILTFNFTIIRTLEEKNQHLLDHNYTIKSGYAFHYDDSTLTTTAFISVADLAKQKINVDQTIKKRLTAVTNKIAEQYKLLPLS